MSRADIFRHAFKLEAEIQTLRTRLAESEAEVGRLRDTLEAVTECEEHRPCGLCRERVRRAVEVKP